jgi:hypothetical protein
MEVNLEEDDENVSDIDMIIPKDIFNNICKEYYIFSPIYINDCVCCKYGVYFFKLDEDRGVPLCAYLECVNPYI